MCKPTPESFLTQIEHLQMVVNRLRADVDRLALELWELKQRATAAPIHPAPDVEIDWEKAGYHPGESWQVED